MAKTLLGKELEKYLQQKAKDTFELEAVISLGEYEGTFNMEDIEKLRKQLNNKTEDIEEIEKNIESIEKKVEAADFAIDKQEKLALIPIVTPAGPQVSPAIPLLIREKAKEQADDLKEVIKEQGKSTIKMIIDGLKNAREALNKAGDDMKESLQQTRESL
jgi:DNA mismatch repair ATPase MutS